MFKLPILKKYENILLFKPDHSILKVQDFSLVLLQYNKRYISSYVIPLFSAPESYSIKYYKDIQKSLLFPHNTIVVLRNSKIDILDLRLNQLDYNTLSQTCFCSNPTPNPEEINNQGARHKKHDQSNEKNVDEKHLKSSTYNKYLESAKVSQSSKIDEIMPQSTLENSADKTDTKQKSAFCEKYFQECLTNRCSIQELLEENVIVLANKKNIQEKYKLHPKLGQVDEVFIQTNIEERNKAFGLLRSLCNIQDIKQYCNSLILRLDNECIILNMDNYSINRYDQKYFLSIIEEHTNLKKDTKQTSLIQKTLDVLSNIKFMIKNTSVNLIDVAYIHECVVFVIECNNIRYLIYNGSCLQLRDDLGYFCKFSDQFITVCRECIANKEKGRRCEHLNKNNESLLFYEIYQVDDRIVLNSIDHKVSGRVLREYDFSNGYTEHYTFVSSNQQESIQSNDLKLVFKSFEIYFLGDQFFINFHHSLDQDLQYEKFTEKKGYVSIMVDKDLNEEMTKENEMEEVDQYLDLRERYMKVKESYNDFFTSDSRSEGHSGSCSSFDQGKCIKEKLLKNYKKTNEITTVKNIFSLGSCVSLNFDSIFFNTAVFYTIKFYLKSPLVKSVRSIAALRIENILDWDVNDWIRKDFTPLVPRLILLNTELENLCEMDNLLQLYGHGNRETREYNGNKVGTGHELISSRHKKDPESKNNISSDKNSRTLADQDYKDNRKLSDQDVKSNFDSPADLERSEHLDILSSDLYSSISVDNTGTRHYKRYLKAVEIRSKKGMDYPSLKHQTSRDLSSHGKSQRSEQNELTQNTHALPAKSIGISLSNSNTDISYLDQGTANHLPEESKPCEAILDRSDFCKNYFDILLATQGYGFVATIPNKTFIEDLKFIMLLLQADLDICRDQKTVVTSFMEFIKKYYPIEKSSFIKNELTCTECMGFDDRVENTHTERGKESLACKRIDSSNMLFTSEDSKSRKTKISNNYEQTDQFSKYHEEKVDRLEHFQTELTTDAAGNSSESRSANTFEKDNVLCQREKDLDPKAGSRSTSHTEKIAFASHSSDGSIFQLDSAQCKYLNSIPLKIVGRVIKHLSLIQLDKLKNSYWEKRFPFLVFKYSERSLSSEIKVPKELEELYVSISDWLSHSNRNDLSVRLLYLLHKKTKSLDVLMKAYRIIGDYVTVYDKKFISAKSIKKSLKKYNRKN